MAHPKELITKIADLLAVEYPPRSGFSFIYERPINQWFKKELGRSMMSPDITILSANRPVCVVEIGYTRPEKLTAYRNVLKIPDVRWYAKDGVLHGDVQERVVSVSIDAEPTGNLYAYPIWGMIPHVGCRDVEYDVRRVPDKAYDRYVRRFGDDAYMARVEKLEEAESEDVFTYLVTDYVAVWLPCFCDKCGAHWFADNEDGEVAIEMCRYAPREIADYLGTRREPIKWHMAREEMEKWGLSLNYMDGHFLKEADRGHLCMRAREMK